MQNQLSTFRHRKLKIVFVWKGTTIYFKTQDKYVYTKFKYIVGGVAHMVERSLCMREARGSIPCTSMIIIEKESKCLKVTKNNFYIRIKNKRV